MTPRTSTRTSGRIEHREEFALFEELQLEEQDWYWNITLLTLGMAILVIVDLLYDFPAAPLTKNVFGTGDIQQNFAQIVLEYLIFYGLVGFVLFMYTLVLLTLEISESYILQWCCQNIFGLNSQWQSRLLKAMGYMVILMLLAGTMSFNLLLFYENNAFSRAWWNAIMPFAFSFGPAPP
jgi:hypothetical protein